MWRKRGSTVLAITSWPFDDALVRRYTLPYIEMIRSHLGPDGAVLLVTQEPSGRGAPASEVPEGVRLVPHPYVGFGWKAVLYSVLLLVRVVALGVRHRPRAIHVFATPAGVHGYLASVLLRVPLVIDSFEPHAEAMVENGTWTPSSPAFRILDWFERRQARRASAVIAPTAAMRDYASQRWGAQPGRFYVKPACVDLEQFRPSTDVQRRAGPSRICCVYAGKLGGIYLDRELFDFFRAAADRWGTALHIDLLTDADPDTIAAHCRAVGLDPAVVEARLAPPHEVPDVLRGADFAINPVKPVPTKRYCTSIKDGEYWASGLPVVITRGISDDSDVIASRGIGVVIEELSPQGYDAALRELEPLFVEPRRSEVRARARATAEELRTFDIARRVYDDLYG